VEKRVVSVAQPPVEEATPPAKSLEGKPKTGNLPSFLRGNPWVEILSSRRS
jgi:hypothetical protein